MKQPTTDDDELFLIRIALNPSFEIAREKSWHLHSGAAYAAAYKAGIPK